jgi:hypothetical protein
MPALDCGAVLAPHGPPAAVELAPLEPPTRRTPAPLESPNLRAARIPLAHRAGMFGLKTKVFGSAFRMMGLGTEAHR